MTSMKRIHAVICGVRPYDNLTEGESAIARPEIEERRDAQRQ